jgi:Ser/Thr protein kinase RdoA (MazF antagonist)
MSRPTLGAVTDRLLLIAQDALERCYGLGDEASICLLSISENATFAVDAPGRPRAVLRVHRPGYHSRAAIDSELAWIAALRADRVVSTPQVLPAADGSAVALGRHPDGEWRHVVRFAWVEGVQPSGDRLVHDFRTLGAITARLHAHARGWRPPAGFTRFRWDVETAVGEHGHWGRWRDGVAVGPAERALFGRLVEVLRRRLGAFGHGPDRFGLVHADMRLANLLVSGGDVPDLDRPDPADRVNVIDFDDSGHSWFLYDLAASLSFIEHEPYVPELIDAWVGGYREVAPLTAAEEAELPTFVLLRRLLLVAWIGSHGDTETAQQLGAGYTAGSAELAEDYLTRFG